MRKGISYVLLLMIGYDLHLHIIDKFWKLTKGVWPIREYYFAVATPINYFGYYDFWVAYWSVAFILVLVLIRVDKEVKGYAEVRRMDTEGPGQ